jgi:hypothetical protein
VSPGARHGIDDEGADGRAWLAGHGGLDAEILDQEAAVECGRLNFGTPLTGLA